MPDVTEDVFRALRSALGGRALIVTGEPTSVYVHDTKATIARALSMYVWEVCRSDGVLLRAGAERDREAAMREALQFMRDWRLAREAA